MNAQDEHREQTLITLEETASHYKAILKTTVDAIITIDSHGIVQTFNSAAEKIFGYRAEEVIGNNVKMLMPKPYRSEHDGYLGRYLETGVPKIIGLGRQVTGLRKDGTEFPMDLAVSEVPLKDKRLFTGIVRDITERKRLEEQLVQSAKLAAVGKLVSGIAHEVNNPVSIIKMHIASVMQNTESHKLSDSLPRVFLDPIRIEQVLVNLFNNAIDTMSHGDVLTVSTALETDETHRDWVVIRVKDTGEGIEEKHIDQLFDPFFTTKEVGEGTGLGLSVSYGLIQEHGGRIEVSSQQSKGTEFQIYLPVTE